MKYRLTIIAALVVAAYRHGRRGAVKETAKILRDVFTFPNSSRARALRALGAKQRAAIRRLLGDRDAEPPTRVSESPLDMPTADVAIKSLFIALGLDTSDISELSQDLQAIVDEAVHQHEAA